MSQTLPAEIFKAYDIRGIVNKSLTADVVRQVGQALGTLVLEQGQTAIAVGRDGRLSGPELAVTAERLNRQHARERTEEHRLRLAFFLALAPAPYTDRARALRLLDVAPHGDSAGRNHPLAQLLLPLLQEQKRLDENLATSQQRNRELQLNHDQLRQKLEAIREIELRMLERTPKK